MTGLRRNLEVLGVLDQLDLVGVDAEPEALAQQPTDLRRDLHLIDTGDRAEPEQAQAAAGLVGYDVRLRDSGTARSAATISA